MNQKNKGNGDDILPQSAEEKLQQAERRIVNILESFSDAFFTADREWRFTYVNRRAEQILGRPAAELLDKNMWEEFPEAVETVMFDYYQKAVAEQVTVEFEIFYPPFDSWFEVRAYPSQDGGLSVYFHNINERKLADDALRASEERYRMLFNSIDEGFCVLQMFFDENDKAVDFKFLEINPAFEKLTGIPAEDALSEKTMRQIVPDLEEKWFEIYGSVALTGKPRRVADISEALRSWFDVYPFRVGEPEERKVAVLFNNITERKLAEEHLRESRERLNFALEAAQIGDWDLDLTTGDASRSFLHDKCFGATDQKFDEWSYDKFKSFVHPDDVEEVDRKFGQALKDRKEWSFECRVIWADKSIHWIEAHGSVYCTIDGKPARMLGIVTDITQRKRAEKNLEFLAVISQELARLSDVDEILEIMCGKIGRYFGVDNCIFAEVDTVANTANVNPLWRADETAVDFSGFYQLSEFVSDEFRQTLMADRAVVVNDVAQDSRTADNAEKFHQLKICSFINTPYVSEGILKFVLGVYRQKAYEWRTDEIELVGELMTRVWMRIERARAEKALRESEQHLAAMVNQTISGIAETDLIGQFIFVNDRFCEITGYSREELLGGLRMHDITHPDDLSGNAEQFRLLAEKGIPFTIEKRYLRKDGSIIWVKNSVSATVDAEGKRQSVVGVMVDITENKRAETERERFFESEQEARRQAEQANGLKDEFLATLSHELRTPLNSILGWAQMLQSNNLGADESKKALSIIERNARAQNQLIEDLLDVSRIITGKLRLDVQAVDLPNVITAAVDAARPAAEAKNIRLQTLLDPQAGPVSGDPDRLQQIVWNLLSNAVKFTPKDGRIQIRLERVNSHIEIVVSDTGKGIEPEFLPHVFDRFRQSDGSMTRRHGGLGLGLAIVRQLVELHGGMVSVESDGHEKGTTFTVSLPVLPVRRDAAKDEKSRVHPKTEKDGAGLECPPELDEVRILLVEDEADSRELVSMVLEQCGAKIVTADSAAEALEAVRREKFHIIISDIGMPDEDGFALIGKIRQLNEEQNGKTPAIALTAYARAEDRVRALRSGFQMHIAKPVEPAELIAVVANLAGRIKNQQINVNS